LITAIFSDVHGNLPALEAFITATNHIADSYLCLGDVVNYGPWNDECLEIVYSLPGIHYLEGNHERLFLGKDPLDEENPLVKDFFHSSIRGFTSQDLISNLPDSCQMGSFTCSHTIGKTNRIYADTDIAVDRNHIIGHSHHQFRIKRAGYEIINCGSIGQNRKWIDTINYVLMDSSNSEITLCTGPYRFAELIREMEIQDFPQNCIDYYLGKPRKTKTPS
jgi:predicted phosphodiesterase